ncbi:MAG: DUF2812 domain-containing protein [Tissierellia bacterium]|nr:DUF2812 domain-containing protein [Tissierellia bacterium]
MSFRGPGLCELGPFHYTFDQGLPGKNQYRSMLLDHWLSREISQSNSYLAEDTGAEYLGPVLSWVYFRKKSSLGTFETVPSRDSKENKSREYKVFSSGDNGYAHPCFKSTI